MRRGREGKRKEMVVRGVRVRELGLGVDGLQCGVDGMETGRMRGW